MVLPAGQYSTIYSREGAKLAKHVEVQTREASEVDGVHVIITALVNEEQASKLTLWTTY